VDKIDQDTQLGLTGVYMFTDYFGLELLASTPFKHDIKVKGLGALDIREVGDTKLLPPTLSAQLYPLGFFKPDFKLQPYVGVGLNYTIFWSEDASSELSKGLGQVTGVDENYSFDLDNSWGIAVHAGLDFVFLGDFLFNVAVRWIDIETDASFKGKKTGTKVKADNVDIDPWVYTIGVGYRF
jgi:outer membrane protein